MRDLQRQGKLSSIEGLSWYSWKDTGITEMIDMFGSEAARKQANHATEEMTRRYYHQGEENKELREFNLDWMEDVR